MYESKFRVGSFIGNEFVLSILSGSGLVKHQIGVGLQFLVLTATPLISWWQLQFGFNLIWMPALLVVAILLFWIGTRLRESN
jgi:hypothetical protein